MKRRGSPVQHPARAAALAVGVTALMVRRVIPRWKRAIDPCGPLGSTMPIGTPDTVVTDDGASLAVTISGPAQGPVALLSHCWSGSRSVWAAVARRLVLNGYRVVMYDQRGHGTSTLGSDPLTIERLGADLGAVLEQLDLHQVVLIGHSMGGMSVQSFVTGHPDQVTARVRAMVLVATAAQVTPGPIPDTVMKRFLGDAMVKRLEGRSIGLMMVRSSVGRRPCYAHVALTRDLFVETSEAARVGCMVAMSHMDLRESLTSVRLPTTVMVGTRDRLTPPRLAHTIATQIPGAQLLVLPGAGHMLPLEEPDRILDAIRRVVRTEPTQLMLS